jgi:hypothetical protein
MYSSQFQHHFEIFEKIINFAFILGDLLSGTECLDYISKFVNNESITRSEGNTNFKKFAFVPKVNRKMWSSASSLASNERIKASKPTLVSKQYIIFTPDKVLNDVKSLQMITNSNTNSFSSWTSREYYSECVRIVSPLPSELASFRSGSYSCTCRTYMDEYDCEHALAISIIKNRVASYVSMDLPMGQRKGPGRPRKAVKGALNHQNTRGTKLDIIEAEVTEQLKKSSTVEISEGNFCFYHKDFVYCTQT